MNSGTINLVFRISANNQIGSGHLFHALTLNEEINARNTYFLLKDCDSFVSEQLSKNQILFEDETNLDQQLKKLYKKGLKNIIINDILDTKEKDISIQKKIGFFVVNIEDLGEGSKLADVVINALYSKSEIMAKQYVGPKYTILRSEFIENRDKVDYSNNELILVSFGGTDPSHISEFSIKALEKIGLPYLVIEPPFRKLEDLNNKNILKAPVKMAKTMSQARLMITSMGRTVLESAFMGIPIISIAQHKREASHTSTNLEKSIYLGEIDNLAESTFIEAVENLYHSDKDCLEQRKWLMKEVDSEGKKRIVKVLNNL